jgi:hypothetical protein
VVVVLQEALNILGFKAAIAVEQEAHCVVLLRKDFARSRDVVDGADIPTLQLAASLAHASAPLMRYA